MAWLARLPLWVKVAVPAVVVAVVLCNLVGRPKNPHNYQADTLATTRKAYQEDTLRLIAFNDSLKVREAAERAAKEAEHQRWIEAEQRAAAARVTAANARGVLKRAKTVRDSLDAALVLIAKQDDVIAADSSALLGAAAAFGRLTAEHRATLERADSLEAGWRRTRDRLGLAEAALVIEQKRTSCTVNLIVTHVKCPSRGAVAVVSLAAGAVGAVMLQPRN